MKSTLLSIALVAAAASASAPAMANLDLAKKHNCTACHAVDKKLVGPSYKDVAAKHKGKPDAAMLAEKIKKGGSGVYGPVPMPPNASVPDADIKVLVDWIMSGAK